VELHCRAQVKTLRQTSCGSPGFSARICSPGHGPRCGLPRPARLTAGLCAAAVSEVSSVSLRLRQRRSHVCCLPLCLSKSFCVFRSSSAALAAASSAALTAACPPSGPQPGKPSGHQGRVPGAALVLQHKMAIMRSPAVLQPAYGMTQETIDKHQSARKAHLVPPLRKPSDQQQLPPRAPLRIILAQEVRDLSLLEASSSVAVFNSPTAPCVPEEQSHTWRGPWHTTPHHMQWNDLTHM